MATRKSKPGVRKQIQEKERRISELEEKIAYLQAEFDNYRKSLEKQKADHEELASARIVKDLLEFLDDIEQAAAKSRDTGLGLLKEKLMKILGRNGLKSIEAIGKAFDHYYHEAVMRSESDKQEGTVLEELQKGYMLNSRVIRHSKVRVARG
jgi:molecular chaperone GrpE